MDSHASVNALLERITSAASTLPADGSLEPETRRELQDIVKELGFALETPLDTLNRFNFLVRFLQTPTL